jgi:uncharacterized oligopeptide transporter (OPT) family protein
MPHAFTTKTFSGIVTDRKETPPRKQKVTNMPTPKQTLDTIPKEESTRQLTVRAVASGLLIGFFVSMINVYFGLQIGWGVGGSMISAIVAYALFQQINPKTPYTLLENNISQTTGSAGGGMASAVGAANLLPALHMLGYSYPFHVLLLWGCSVALIGVCFMVPLRRQMIVSEGLHFPSGVATAEIITAMYTEGKIAMRKARSLFYAALAAALITLALYFLPSLSKINLFTWIGLSSLTALGFQIYLSPMLFGAGFIIGTRIGVSLLLGAILGWLVIGHFVTASGWVSGPTFDYKTGLQSWLLWPGVALMVGESMMALLLSWKSIIRSFYWPKSKQTHAPDNIPNIWWIGGLIIASLLTLFTLHHFFHIVWYLTLLSIVLALVLAMIATRSLGETDINPIGAMGKISQLAFNTQNISMNLMAAGVASGAAAAAGDMMQDLKTGFLLKASPKKQFLAQCIGVFSGIIGAVSVYKLFEATYTFGGETFPAPSAEAWRAMAMLLTQGLNSLPPHTEQAVLCALIISALLPILRRIKPISEYIPSGLAMGIAFIVPAYDSLVMFLGTLTLILWQRSNPKQQALFAYPIAAGLIVGDGLMGIVNALLHLFGVQPLLV